MHESNRQAPVAAANQRQLGETAPELDVLLEKSSRLLSSTRSVMWTKL